MSNAGTVTVAQLAGPLQRVVELQPDGVGTVHLGHVGPKVNIGHHTQNHTDRQLNTNSTSEVATQPFALVQ